MHTLSRKREASQVVLPRSLFVAFRKKPLGFDGGKPIGHIPRLVDPDSILQRIQTNLSEGRVIGLSLPFACVRLIKMFLLQMAGFAGPSEPLDSR